MTIDLGTSINRSFEVKVYGEDMSDLKLGTNTGQITYEKDKSGAGFALVRGYAIGDVCERLPFPIILAVPGTGSKPDQSDKCAKPGEMLWRISLTDNTAMLDVKLGSVEDILDKVSAKGIDGGIQIENPRYENGRIRATLHIWVKIKIIGQEAGFDERIPIDIPVQGCHTVWDNGWANVKICYRPTNNVCVELCVGKWGFEKCWEACWSFALASEACIEEAAC